MTIPEDIYYRRMFSSLFISRTLSSSIRLVEKLHCFLPAVFKLL